MRKEPGPNQGKTLNKVETLETPAEVPVLPNCSDHTLLARLALLTSHCVEVPWYCRGSAPTSCQLDPAITLSSGSALTLGNAGCCVVLGHA